MMVSGIFRSFSRAGIERQAVHRAEGEEDLRPGDFAAIDVVVEIIGEFRIEDVITEADRLVFVVHVCHHVVRTRIDDVPVPVEGIASVNA